VNIPENRQPTSSVTFSMLISETVYKMVVGVERTIGWTSRVVLRPCLLQLRCLFWYTGTSNSKGRGAVISYRVKYQHRLTLIDD